MFTSSVLMWIFRIDLLLIYSSTPGHVVQSITCLTEDPGVAKLILAWSLTFVEIDHEIISTVILLPSSD